MKKRHSRFTLLLSVHYILLALVGYAVGLCLMALLAIGGGCARRIIYIPQETTVLKTDTVERTMVVHQRDTVSVKDLQVVHVKDSMAPNLDSLGRIIGWNYWHWRDSSSTYEMQLKSSRDSLSMLTERLALLERSVKPVPVDRIVEVPAPIPWWVKTLAVVGASVLIITLIIIAIRRFKHT